MRRALEKRIDNSFGRWDDRRGGPELQKGQERGIQCKWDEGVKDILDASWYAWQDLVAEREDIVRIETEIDRFTADLTKLDVQNRLYQELIDVPGPLRSQLAERSILEERVPRLAKKVEELREVFAEWPQAAAAIDEWNNQKHEPEERAKSLELELGTARHREGAAAIVRSYEYILKAQQNLHLSRSSRSAT